MLEPNSKSPWLERDAGRSSSPLPSLLSLPSLGRILELAMFLRVAAAVAVEWAVQRQGQGRVCLFPDAEGYWTLAGTIRMGTLYQIVEWGDIPRFAQRTPGYPAFLAGCRTILGESPLGVRLVQAGLGVLTVWLVYRLTLEVLGKADDDPKAPGAQLGNALRSRPTIIALVAALLTAVHPYLVVMSALILSEAVFVPVMLVALWGMAVLWNDSPAGVRATRGRMASIALGVGAASGAAILIRPSWALFVPLMLGCWLGCRYATPGRGGVLTVLGGSALVLLGLGVVMSPWWVRNARVYGRFVPTAIWMGASLYDGLNPEATGASNMAFLERQDIWPLDEMTQDRMLTRRAVEFARTQPGRAFGAGRDQAGALLEPVAQRGGFGLVPSRGGE